MKSNWTTLGRPHKLVPGAVGNFIYDFSGELVLSVHDGRDGWVSTSLDSMESVSSSCCTISSGSSRVLLPDRRESCRSARTRVTHNHHGRLSGT